MKSKKGVYGALVVALIIVLFSAAFTIANMAKTIKAQRQDIDTANGEVNDLRYEMLLKQQELDGYIADAIDAALQRKYVSSLIEEREEYMAKFGVFTIFDYDTLINRNMPEGALKLLEDMVTSISTSDEELYKSLFYPELFEPGSDPDVVAYMMAPFNNNKGRSYIIRQISSYTTDIATLQSGGYYAVVVAEAEGGRYFYHPAVGITLDAELNRWIIYDFD